MQPELQLKLLHIFHYSLKPTGCLFLGTSESLGEMSSEFDSLDSKAKLFRRKLTSNKTDRIGEQPFRHVSIIENAERPSKSMKRNPPPLTVRQAVAELLANNFAPPTVIVNTAGDIVHVHGRTGQFLELTSGGPPKNILSMAREGLELDLAAALRSAAAKDDPVVFENVPIIVNAATVLTLLTVQRISEPESIAGLLRVSFQAAPTKVLSNTNATSETSPTNKSRRDIELEKEIQYTRQTLQRTIEELDASNEEMTSPNEELQSTNEELQSTNEELETSKEELQSLNEELETINSEFQNKIRELSQSNDDMRNLLNSTEIATIFLDNRLCIKSYTEQAKRIIRLIPSDVGRPLQDLTSHLEGQHVVSLAEEVLRTLAFKECEVQTDEGRWLLLRILPYRTSNEKIDGLVMTFIDINELKRTQSAIQHAKTYAENIVETIREPLLILDDQLRVQSANRAFYKRFRTTQEKTINHLLYDLGSGQLDIPQLRESLNSILLNNSTFDDFLVEHSFPKTGTTRMLLNARCISGTEKNDHLILLAIEEVSK